MPVTNVLALVALDFDPLLRLGEITVRWQTIGTTVGLLVALAVAAMMVPDIEAARPFRRRRRVAGHAVGQSGGRPDRGPQFPDAPVMNRDGTLVSGRPLRIDDMLFIVAAIVPGAVLGGRLVHAAVYPDAYAANPGWLFDPGVGSLSLLGAVLGGLLSAVYVARLIGAPVRRWADAAAVPMLLALGIGKLAQLFGGSGQGVPFDGAWAVAFVGAGPWVSGHPAIAAHPAQVYEGLWLLLGIPLVLLFGGAARRYRLRADPLEPRAGRIDEGRRFVLALGWFLAGRVLVGFFWRDESIVGPLNTEQVLALAALVGTVLWLWLRDGRQVAASAP